MYRLLELSFQRKKNCQADEDLRKKKYGGKKKLFLSPHKMDDDEMDLMNFNFVLLITKFSISVTGRSDERRA